MRAGSRDALITFERAVTAQASDGEETSAWGPVVGDDPNKEWAAVHYGRGDERRQAAVERGQQSAVFQVLDNAMTRSVGVKDRILHDGVWDIVGVAPDTPNRGEIEFTGVRTL